MIAAMVSSILPILLMIIYVGVIVYFILLAGRLVRAVERIADKFEKHSPTESERR